MPRGQGLMLQRPEAGLIKVAGSYVVARRKEPQRDLATQSGTSSRHRRGSEALKSAHALTSARMAALTRGMTCSALSCMERLASSGDTQSIPA
jgi:hypothetical protein